MKKFLLLIILASFMFSGIVLTLETEKLDSLQVEEIRKKISTLGSGTSFAYVDLGLTEDELILIDNLNFDNLMPETTREYNLFGNLHLLKDQLIRFLRGIGNNDETVLQKVSEIISRVAYDVAKGANKESAWICVRASKPNHDFDIPRWHVDGKYYGFYSSSLNPEVYFKFGAVLKGKPTLLYNLPDEMRELFNSNADDRLFLSQLLDLNDAESPKRGQGVVFIVADDKIGGVHSEPMLDENRLFFSVLVGNKSEINELYSRWHPAFN